MSAPTLDTLQAQLVELTAEVRQLRAAVPSQMVDLKTAADYLGVSTRTVRRLVADGAVPFRRVGRALRFRKP